MADEVKPDNGQAADGGGTAQDGTPAPAAKKKIEFGAEEQEFIQGKIDDAYGRAFKKAETQFGGQLAEAQAKLESLTKELTALKEGQPAKGDKGKEGDGDSAKPGQATKAEIEKEVERLRAHVVELQDGLKTLKTERDGLKTSLESSEKERREASKFDKFLSAIPDKLKFFSPKEAYALAIAEGQLQLNEKGDLVVINPETGFARLGRDMEPMTAADYIAEFAAKRKWMVEAEVTDGVGAGESGNVSVRKGPKDYAKMTAAEMEAEIQRVKNQVR